MTWAPVRPYSPSMSNHFSGGTVSHRKKTLKWRNKLLILLSVFSVAPVAVVAYFTSKTLETSFREYTLDSLEALASAKAEAIDQFTEYRQDDVERIAKLIAPYVFEVINKAPRQENPPKLQDAQSPFLSTPDSASSADAGIGSPDEDAGPQDAATGSSDQGPVAPPDKRQDGTKKRPTAPDQAEVARVRAALKQPLGLILWHQNVFEELLVLDNDGLVIASTFDGHEQTSAGDLEYFQQGKKTTYVQPVFISPITKQLTMIIATPIRDESFNDLGVLAARLNLERFYRLIGDQTGLGQTGETVVVKKIEAELAFMAPTRHRADAALNPEFSLPLGAERARALQEAARGQSGSGLAADYRGVPTIAAWRYVPSLDWGLMVKIDDEEAIRSARKARTATIFLTFGVLLVIIIAAFVVSRAFIRPLQELKEATDRLSRGDMNVQLDIHSQDEIGELADSFERMVAAIKFFRERSRGTDEDEVVDSQDRVP